VRLKWRRRQVSTVSLFGKDSREFLPKTGTSWHGGDILGNKCRKLMSWARLVFEQMKAFLLEKLEEDGGSERAKQEVAMRCDIVAKPYCCLTDSFLF
jgi:hypothetical protein